MAFAPGTAAFVTVGGSPRTFDTWNVVLSCDTADVSDYDRVAARFLYGLPVARVTMGGPYAVGALGMRVGVEYSVVFGITAVVGITLTVLVTNITPKTAVRGVAQCEVAGVVNSDWPTAASVIAL